MMFLVIFGSLAAVMAVVAQGNMRTAHAHLRVSRASSAAETGISFANRRLLAAARRFVIEKGTIDDAFADRLWTGSFLMDDGVVQVLPPTDFIEASPARGLAEAVMNAHLADEHSVIINPGDELLPAIDEFARVLTPPIPVTQDDPNVTFQITYEPLADGRFIRITVIGRDHELSRTIRAEYQIVKRLDAAIISPNRIMIGKNVHIEGPIGSRYGETAVDLEADNGHPIVMLSDFHGLNAGLDTNLDTLLAKVQEFDVDGDGRLRANHPSENQGLTEPFLYDVNGDGYVDDYDLWLDFYDANNDTSIVWDADLAFEAGYGSLSPEFSGVDDQLGALIDGLRPDRNGDGVVDSEDTVLGYMDGVVNNYDHYAKVSGNLMFKASRAEWEARQGNIDYQSVVQGPIQPGIEKSPVAFEVPDTELYDLSASDFTGTQDTLKALADPGAAATLDEQLALMLGEDPAAHVWSDHATDPDYLNPDLGLWEQMPHGSPGFYDWYKRPVYKNMTFVNLHVPMGNNGLYVNCTFVGAVYIETHPDNEHPFWNFLGMKEEVGGEYIDKYDYLHWDPPLEITPGTPCYDTKPYSNNIRFHDCTFVGSIVADPINEYTHVRNKLQFTGNTRFSLDAEEIESTNLDGSTKVLARQSFEDNLDEFEKSSLLTPNYSVDVGNFTNADEKVELSGTIIAGVIDIRGSADLHGTLLTTYIPVAGEGPLYFGGSVAAFNTTIGYFGPEWGDGEGTAPDPALGFGNITIRYNPDVALPDGILAPIKIAFVRGTYREGSAP